MKLVEHLGVLYQQELWEDLVFMYELLPPTLPLPPKTMAFVHTYGADAYFHLDKHLLAQKVN